MVPSDDPSTTTHPGVTTVTAVTPETPPVAPVPGPPASAEAPAAPAAVPNPPADPASPPPAAPDSGDVDVAARVVQDAGLDYAELTDHYAENGALADEHYTALEAKGYPRQLVDNYLRGMDALSGDFRGQVLSGVGGEDVFTVASEWAVANLTPAEIAAYNAAVESGDIERAKLAVQGLIARHEREVGHEPDLAEGQSGVADIAGYASRTQMITDMQDPRYAKDPAFRAEVARRVAASRGLF